MTKDTRTEMERRADAMLASALKWQRRAIEFSPPLELCGIIDSTDMRDADNTWEGWCDLLHSAALSEVTKMGFDLE